MDATEVSGQLSTSTWSDVASAYRRHSADIAALALLLSGSRETAEDLVQEAFIRLAGRFGHIRNKDQLLAYLRRTVINLHLSRLRRLRLERAWLSRHSGATSTVSEDADFAAHADLVRALRLLAPRQRVAVILRYCLDFSETQVADAMGCSTSAARNLVERGIRRLREVGGANERHS